jgi:hypothetical protein
VGQVGKSTFCNLISGAKWLAENGFLQGYEDAMFKTSKGVESMTTGDDAVVLLREWCGLSRIVFALMDTPGLIDSGGEKADSTNIRSIVTRLKEEQKVNCFMLLLNAAEKRFSPQQAQVVKVLDKILSSANAGSFLEHTVIILNQARSDHFDDEEGTKEEYVKKIRHNLRERQVQGGEMQQLVDESTNGGVGLYDDDRCVTVCVIVRRVYLHSTTFVYPQHHLH